MNDTFTERMLPRPAQGQQSTIFGQQSKFDGTSKGSGSIPTDNVRSDLLNLPIYKTKPKEITPIVSSQVSIDLQSNGQASMRVNARNDNLSLNTLKKQINNKFA